MSKHRTYDWDVPSGEEYLPPPSRSRFATSIASALLGSVGKFSPETAARALNHYVWCRPMKCKPSREDAKRLSVATTLQLPFGDRILPAFSWGSGPAILLVHGWGGAASQMTYLATALAQAGFRAIAFDAPAHGSAIGIHTDFPEIGEAVKAAIDFAGEVHAIVAHSAGSVPSLSAIHAGRQVKKLVLISPFARLSVPLAGMARTLKLTPQVVRSHRDILERIYGPEVCRTYSPEWLLDELNVPGLIIHDRKDKEFGWGNAQRLAEEWRGSKLRITDGLGHHRILRDATVALDIATFMAN